MFPLMRRFLRVTGFVMALSALAGIARANDMETAKRMDELKTTLAQAVETAEKALSAQATAASARLENGQLLVDVHLLIEGVCKLVTVDQEGKVGEPKDADQKAERAAHGRDPVTLGKVMAEAKVMLTAAIQTAEAHKKGRAVTIKSRWHGDIVQLQVIVITQKIETVLVDPKTGKVIIPAAG